MDIAFIIMIDPRNKLNELTNTEWMIATKSVWYSRPPKRDRNKIKHPATFAESDIIKLIEFFTKKDQTVLDPFAGTGSTLVACAQTDRAGVGIELSPQWANVAQERISQESPKHSQRLLQGDSRIIMQEIEEQACDFIVTSPPYWMILNKDKDHKATKERTSKGLETNYGELAQDLGNLQSYEEFLQELGVVFTQCYRVLKKNRYLAVVVSDFRHKSEFVPYHQHIVQLVSCCGFSLEGITILAQDSKRLYPYGLPHAFVSNIHHQYILIFRKPKEPRISPVENLRAFS